MRSHNGYRPRTPDYQCASRVVRCGRVERIARQPIRRAPARLLLRHSAAVLRQPIRLLADRGRKRAGDALARFDRRGVGEQHRDIAAPACRRRRLFSAAHFARRRAFTRKILAAARRGFNRPADQGTGGRTADRSYAPRPHRHRGRGLADRAPAVRRKPLSAVDQRRAAASTGDPRSTAQTCCRRPHRGLRHGNFHDRIRQEGARRPLPRGRSESLPV